MEEKRRCRWCNVHNPLYLEYHDREWGVPRFDDGYLYEMLLLEAFQAGLSWECVLNKRENFRRAYDGFAPEKVAAYGEDKVFRLMADPGIIRNQRKIRASIQNSKVFRTITQEYGSFYAYLQTFTQGNILFETGKTTNALSDAISGDLQKRGMAFMGSVTVYSYLQAVGMIDSHEEGCYLHRVGDSPRAAEKSL